MGQEIEKFKVSVFSGDSVTVKQLVEKNKIPKSSGFLDIIPGSLRELYEIKHPDRKDKFSNKEFGKFLDDNQIITESYGNFIYYPWRNLLIKVPPVSDLRLLRTARNQLLITQKEQEKLFSKTILIAGMSVGGNVLEQLVHGGVGGAYVLADMDTLEITNLNRVKTGLADITLPKVLSSARLALELDPYLDIYILSDGINSDSMESVFESLRLDLMVDEVDDIAAKILLRQKAQAKKLPLLMATDNSDGALIDVERYDLEQTTPLFNGRIPDVILEKMISGSLTREEVGAAIGTFFVGLDLVDNRLLKSLLEVRKSIPSWPQLGTAASMSGILAGYATRQILLGNNLNSNRYVASFDKDMNPEFLTDDYKKDRENLLVKLQSQK